MRASIRGKDIYYRSVGTGLPIVALHGYSLDHRVMQASHEPVFRSRKGYRRIYLDLPGMGRSTGGLPRDSDEMLELLEEFVDSVIPNERLLLTGASYGGYLARGIVKRSPSRVVGLLLAVPAIIAEYEMRTLPPHKIIAQDAEFLQSLNVPEREEFASEGTVLTEEVWKRYRAAINTSHSEADKKRLAAFRANHYSYSFDVDALDEPFPAPTLMLLGRQDSGVGYADALRIIENYPRASIAILDRAGHNLEMEQPRLFRVLVNEWLDRVEEYVTGSIQSSSIPRPNA